MFSLHQEEKIERERRKNHNKFTVKIHFRIKSATQSDSVFVTVRNFSLFLTESVKLYKVDYV